MPVYDLADMTWTEVRELDRSRTLAILPVGAVEAHGPHLPLATDGVIAMAMTRAAAARLEAQGHPVLVLPALTYTAATFAAGFAGTLGLRRSTVTATVVDLGAHLARHGFRVLVVANAHFDPEHIASLEDAVRVCREEHRLTVVFPDVTRRPWASRLTEEFKSGACHAGRYEGSVVLAAAPQLVRREAMQRLPPNPRSLSAAIRAGKRTFEEAGGSEAYFGAPAEATAEEGRATIEVLGQILTEAALAALGR